MDHFDRIEPESETHRTEKALRTLIPGVKLPLAQGSIGIVIDEDHVGTPVGQHLLVLLVHLLARMKGVVRSVAVHLPTEVPVLPGVPLVGPALDRGLEGLVGGLTGPESRFGVDLEIGPSGHPDVLIAVGDRPAADITLGADAWRALCGGCVAWARWEDRCPLGPYMAATIGSAEVLKRLLSLNFGIAEAGPVGDLAFSLFDYGVDREAGIGPDVAELEVRDLAVAGAGAGGTAALYTLASFPLVHGEVTAVEPGRLKESSLGRYLMSDYEQVHAGVHKLESAGSFLRTHVPGLLLSAEPRRWHEVRREWGTVLCTVDTPDARWDVQRSGPRVILEAGVAGTLYAILRVVAGGWCMECKHPPDPGLTWKRRALRWGLSVEEVKRRSAASVPVARADLERLAWVQNRSIEDFLDLEGMPFDQVPALTECGETPLALAVPSQAPVLPLATTAAGIGLAAEVVKDLTGVGQRLLNYFAHDLRYRPRADAQRFRPRRAGCRGCPEVA
ncbi:MAG TPA: hypothetical protein VGS09_11700 [Actinomycetota bacterium]|jgi:hypothetical protein|nr:hypothetical protein [Actinomycetota bacterium]